MRAAVVRTPGGPIEIEEREHPIPGPDEVLIRVRACGVCHGDVMVKEGQFPFARYPVVPGHEIAGIIEAVGERVRFLTPGAPVGVSALFSSCGVCWHCLGADEFLCDKLEFTGVTKDGGFQEYMVAPAAYVLPLPETMEFAEAAPLMCAGLTVFSGMRHAGFKLGDKVAVIGLGGLGHMAVLFAKSMGGRVAVISTSGDKKAQAQALGAEQFIHVKTKNPADALKAWDGGADLILATAPDAETMAAAFAGLAGNGTMMVLGAPFAPISVSAFDLIMGRRRLMGSPAGSRKDMRDMLAFAAQNRIRPQVDRVSLEHLSNAFNEMGKGHMSGRTVVVMK
ncbi:MAG TPA: alcohol dehydrogenase catalytic domain-containing protein [Candidatus Udaeobacter sp.]|nr:alcohol dehydrogenase catalytic domain-containing protein [Candidatus Udaeobacter sp.]